MPNIAIAWKARGKEAIETAFREPRTGQAQTPLASTGGLVKQFDQLLFCFLQ